jgi:hypothetical protein
MAQPQQRQQLAIAQHHLQQPVVVQQQPQQLAIVRHHLQQPVVVQQQPQQPVADDWLVFVSKIRVWYVKTPITFFQIN